MLKKLLEVLMGGPRTKPKYDHLERVQYHNPITNRNELFLITSRYSGKNGEWIYGGQILKFRNTLDPDIPQIPVFERKERASGRELSSLDSLIRP